MIFAARVLLAAALATTAAGQGLLDFESLSSPVDDMEISTQFEVPFGVVFGIDDDGDCIADPNILPWLEARGTDGTDGFISSCGPGSRDTERTDRPDRLGNWFLRTGGPGIQPHALLIEYTTTVAYAASGQIWDIDCCPEEQWQVTAYDANCNVLDTDLSPLGTTSTCSNIYESGAWAWQVASPSGGPPIAKIRIHFLGPSAAGLGFDNFSPTGPCPPNPCPGDINGDGVVDLADLGILLANFGMPCP
jgi:hypothetical protein